VAANNFKGQREVRFSVVRYCNVIGSRGSVIPFFLSRRNDGVLPITHADMTRFNISLEDGVNLVFYALGNAWGGEIFVPRIPSYRILDVAKAIAPDARHEIVGIRPGEKLHEEMITETDAINTIEFKDYFVICPSMPIWQPADLAAAFAGKICDYGFKYNSGTNPHFMTVDEIREQIKQHVDPTFGH